MESFKSKRKSSKPIRKRRHSSESDESLSDDEEDIETKLKDIKELQKQRDKPKGVSAAMLALGKKITKTEKDAEKDPFKRKTGGIVDMKTLNKSDMSKEDVEAIGTAFAAETNRRDEDTEMLKYVEDQLSKKKGNLKDDVDIKPKRQEQKLFALPEKLKIESSNKKTEDMLSNQMLSGIPEIDLGIEAKIKNIEATEDAKQKLVQERMRKRDNEVSDFVPTNMAANYMQHNRFNIEDTAPILKKVEEPKPEPLRVGDAEKLTATSGKKSSSTGKATDDFHYEKFKKQMRRF